MWGASNLSFQHLLDLVTVRSNTSQGISSASVWDMGPLWNTAPGRKHGLSKALGQHDDTFAGQAV